MGKIKRRDLIRTGISLAAVSLFARNPFDLYALLRGKKWVMPEEGRIAFASGKVSVNDIRVEVDDIVRSGDTVTTGEKSEAEIEIRDYSVFRMKENCHVRVDDILKSPQITVNSGWFLIVVKRGSPMEVVTPTVLAGVRGTVLFTKVLSKEEVYFCDCNGIINLANAQTGDQIRGVESEYHTAFLTKQEGPAIKLTQVGLLYHSDKNIIKISERFPEETTVFRKR